MNHIALMDYLSRQFHTIVRHFDENDKETNCANARPDFHDASLFAEVFAFCRELPDALPLLFDVNSAFCYGWVPDCDGSYLIGPVRLSPPVSLARSLKTAPAEDEFHAKTAVCGFQELLSAALLVYNLYHAKELTQADFICRCCLPADAASLPMQLYSEIVFENQECGQKHNPYDQELREQKSIELGEPELLKKSLEEDYIGQLGTLSKDPLQNEKYLAAVVLTLASRSAIRGGLMPEVVFSLQDSYMQEIDGCRDAPRISQLIRHAEFTFADMVREQKTLCTGIRAKENPYIGRCKDYIFSHLHDRLTVADIAGSLALNANYLSELFHACEGITLKNYIRHEKVKLAKNLLTYSGYTYSEIAAYLGFSSQSHLGKVFRQTTGCTLSQYRKEYGSPQFIRDAP